MPVTTEFADGHIDAGENKRLVVTPKDNSGAAIDPQSLDVTLTAPDGTETTFSKSDFTPNGDDFVLRPLFDQGGTWALEVEVTGTLGNTEITNKERIFVQS
jgi:uncharacterized protein YfaS (alpha-2-macroglobulin family)